jgi:hypothetical protein
MVPASERAKTVHALDRSATVTGIEKVAVSILILIGQFNALFI